VPRYHLVVFDFDGTLVDSARCITRSLERALADCGRACDASVIGEQIGLPLHTILRTAAPGIEDDAIEEVIAAYRRHYARLEHELIAAFPGVRDTLRALREAGIALAIATNKLTSRAEVTVERLGLRPLFTAIVGADQARHPKPHPEMLRRVLALAGRAPDEALMVGDTVWDLEMAARAGVASCAVTWGNHPLPRLQEAGPAHIVQSFPALLDVAQPVAR
jgi:phosphoglycolate phosphatase